MRSDGRGARSAGAVLPAKVDGGRLTTSLWLLCRLALGGNDRPNSVHKEVSYGVRRVPEVDSGNSAVAGVPDDRRHKGVRRIGCVPKELVPTFPLARGSSIVSTNMP